MGQILGQEQAQKRVLLAKYGVPRSWGPGIGARAAAAGPRTTPIGSAASGRTMTGRVPSDPPPRGPVGGPRNGREKRKEKNEMEKKGSGEMLKVS
jgi:hypothetical protein